MTEMTEDELKAVLREADRKGILESWVNAYLRSLERRGLIESFIDNRRRGLLALDRKGHRRWRCGLAEGQPIRIRLVAMRLGMPKELGKCQPRVVRK